MIAFLLEYDAQYVGQLDFYTGIGVINKLYEKSEEKRLWDVWLVRYQNMKQDNYESFADFKNSVLKKRLQKIETKSKESIMSEIEKIRKGKVVG